MTEVCQPKNSELVNDITQAIVLSMPIVGIPTVETEFVKILLAEDEREIRELVTLGLKLNGIDVFSVADGQAAIEAASADMYKMVLLDMNMPVLNGKHAAREIRALDAYKNVPILFLSGDDDVGNLDLPNSGSLAKPFTIRELAQRVRDLMTEDSAETHPGD